MNDIRVGDVVTTPWRSPVKGTVTAGPTLINGVTHWYVRWPDVPHDPVRQAVLVMESAIEADELTQLRASVAKLEAALREILAVDSHGFGVPLGTRLKTLALKALEP